MAYNNQTNAMFLGSISGEDLKIVFNTRLQKLYLGDSIKIIDEEKQGIVAQVYKIEHLDLNELDESFKQDLPQLDGAKNTATAEGMASLHIASCKIKLSIIGHKWVNWRGNLPSLNDFVDIVAPLELISHTSGSNPLNPIHLGSYISSDNLPLKLEASFLERTSLVIGDITKEKSNLLNILQEELTSKQANVLIIEPKGGYPNLINSQLLEAGRNFKLSLLEYGVQTLGNLIAGQCDPSMKLKVEALFTGISQHAVNQVKDFLPLSLLKEIVESELNGTEGQNFPAEMATIQNKLIAIEKMGIFAGTEDECPNIGLIFEHNNLITLDISSMPTFWQKAFVRKAIKDLTMLNTCAFVFYEDINRYLDNELGLELVYRTRNFSINNIFMINYQDEVPMDLMKQADNLFLFCCDNADENPLILSGLKKDHELISMLLKRLPQNNVLITGDITNQYPILVELKDSNIYSIRNKHFGSISKTISEHGEIIYTYKSSDQPLTRESKFSTMTRALPTPDFKVPEPPKKDLGSITLEDIDTEIDDMMEDITNTETIYPKITDDFDDEENYDNDILLKPYDEDEPYSHNIPDEEFISEHFIPHKANYEEDLSSFAKQIPDEEFISESIHLSQQTHTAFEHIKHPLAEEEPMVYTKPKDLQPEPEKKKSPLARLESLPDEVEDIPVYSAPTVTKSSAEFNEGDKVQHEKYGTGIISRIIVTGDKQLCTIQFTDYGRRLLDPSRGLKRID